MPKTRLMPMIKKLPINTPPYTDVPDIALSALSTSLINGQVYQIKAEEKTITMNRPGLLYPAFCTLESGVNGVDGLWWWHAKQKVLAACNGIVYLIDQNGNATTLSGATLDVGRVNFTQARMKAVDYAIMASGGALVYTDGVTSSTPVGAGVPTSATHVVWMDDYIIANDKNTSTFRWSDVGIFTSDLVLGSDGQSYACILSHTSSTDSEPVTGTDWQTYWLLTPGATAAWATGTAYFAGWDQLNFANMEAKSDILQALDARFDELILIGKDSVEYWYNDGSTPFVKYEGATSEVGVVSPHSVIFEGNAHWMIDGDRNLVRMTNRAPIVVSNPFARDLQRIRNMDDAFIVPVRADGRDFLALHFPAANLTLAYDIQENAYQGQWGTWNTGTANFDEWIGNCSCKCPDWGFDLVGDRRTGKIYKVSRQYMMDAELPLRMVKTTGWIDYGIKYGKRSNRIRITLERGQGLPDPAQEPLFTKRSKRIYDGQTIQDDMVDGSMGLIGDNFAIVEFLQNGPFIMRQDEYTFSDAVPVTIADAEEELEVMSR